MSRAGKNYHCVRGYDLKELVGKITFTDMTV